MVAGAVAPPRIDLRNDDLVRSHVHAIWLEVAKPDLGKTLTTCSTSRRRTGSSRCRSRTPSRASCKNPVHRAAALAKAEPAHRQHSRRAVHARPGSTTHWPKEVSTRSSAAFDAACDRWRSLYRAAVRQRELHHKIIGDHARPEAERNHSRRLRAQAESQIRLLTEAEGIYEGDFYSYRYFAAEGFLPGYNFPRLPLSAYVPAGASARGATSSSRGRASWRSPSSVRAPSSTTRAPATASTRSTSTSGPTTSRPRTTLPTATMKRCPTCGYAHLEQGTNLAEVCDRCGAALDGDRA